MPDNNPAHDGHRVNVEPRRILWDFVLGLVSDAASERADRSDTLRLLPSAHESAADSPYRKPAEVYEAFEALDALASERRNGSLGRSVEDWLAERGVSYAPFESQTVMGKWGDEREFADGVETRTMQEHIKFGADGDPQYCLRIYVDWDDTAGIWVIGHVRRHLTTTQS